MYVCMYVFTCETLSTFSTLKRLISHVGMYIHKYVLHCMYVCIYMYVCMYVLIRRDEGTYYVLLFETLGCVHYFMLNHGDVVQHENSHLPRIKCLAT